LFAAASTTEAAIADSTRRDGSSIRPSAASESVIECATVKAVTTHSTSTSATRKRHAAPAPCLVHQHGRQQQGEQEQDVVEADPDMPDAFDEVLAESARRETLAGGKALLRTLRREHRGLRQAIELQAQQAAMQGIELEQQAIAEHFSSPHRGAGSAPASLSTA
jgi:MarR-like DNA-binding transcriptional regulator SgrR of sgrS sRNA